MTYVDRLDPTTKIEAMCGNSLTNALYSPAKQLKISNFALQG